jgi:2-polyprenyl-3-methyl-5-hydroxy-6-metoxy-1,4-benzoquinol methylase
MNKDLILTKIIDENYQIHLEQPFYISDNFGFERASDVYFERKIDYTYFPDLNGKKVLDAGCNFGMNSFLLKELYPKAKIKGVDYNEKTIEMAKYINQYKNEDVDFRHGDVKKENFDTYDYILISHLASTYETFINELPVFKNASIIFSLPDEEHRYKELLISYKMLKKFFTTSYIPKQTLLIENIKPWKIYILKYINRINIVLKELKRDLKKIGI